VEFDAVILAGGRSSRLGGVPKARLTVDGVTLLERSLRAARGARRTVVVGPDTGDLPPDVLGCREDPPFAGPAAGIAAGLAALASAALASAAQAAEGGAGVPPLTLVLACDMPAVAGAVSALLGALSAGVAGGPDGVMALSADGRTQPLVGIYGTAALQRAVAGAANRKTLEGGSVFALLASLELRTVPVPPGSTDDVDTWDDASALGASDPGPSASGAMRPNSTLEANGEKPG
jgi:molybdopterin-guanine dinucleotide biosynthesis protein A